MGKFLLNKFVAGVICVALILLAIYLSDLNVMYTYILSAIVIFYGAYVFLFRGYRLFWAIFNSVLFVVMVFVCQHFHLNRNLYASYGVLAMQLIFSVIASKR